MSDELVVGLRIRLGQEDAHYGGDLIDGARILRLFGDVITELTIRTDGDEGLLSGYDDVRFLAAVHPGDFLEVTGRLKRKTALRRVVEFEARKVIAARYDQGASTAEVLDEPIVVCRATGTAVVPYAKASRASKAANASQTAAASETAKPDPRPTTVAPE